MIKIISMKIYLFLIFQLVAISLYAQKNSSITVSLYGNYLSGNQIEIKTTIYPLSSQVGINFGIATDLNSLKFDHNIKAGVIYDFYRRDILSISIGARFIFDRFLSNEFKATHFSYNVDFPLDITYDFLPRFNVSLTVIPTWNKYRYYNNNVGFSYSAGLGYYF